MPVIAVTHGPSESDTGNGDFDWPRFVLTSVHRRSPVSQRIWNPGLKPLADLDLPRSISAGGFGPPGSISAKGVQISGGPNPLADMDRGVQF